MQNLEKLPKWAQERIKEQERCIENLQEYIQQLLREREENFDSVTGNVSEYPSISWKTFVSGKRILHRIPDYSTILFQKDAYTEFSVQYSIADHVLTIVDNNGILCVMPKSTNRITVKSE